MFSVVHNQSNVIIKLEEDLENIGNCPDPSKQVQDAGNCKVPFSCKVLKAANPKLTFDSNKVFQILCQ